jgi:NADPH2:quinone reductase
VRAWRVHELGEPADVLRLEDVEAPRAGLGQVGIEVEAVALNFPDILLCKGMYQERPPLPFTPGLEIAGRVVETGEGAGIPEGSRVIAMPPMPGGGMAERVVAPEAVVFPVPEDMPAAAAASLLIAYQTGHFGLHRRAGLTEGETLLVHAGAGGVGSAAVQLGRAAGARVIATAGGAEKVAVLERLGVDIAIDYTSDDFVEVVKEATGGRGADVIYDPVGGDTFDRSRKCIAWEGRLLVIGFAGGRIPEVPANHVLLKNYSVVGLHWGAYFRNDPRLVHATHALLLQLYEKGEIDPLISAELPLEDAPAALERLGARGTWGRVVLRP